MYFSSLGFCFAGQREPVARDLSGDRGGLLRFELHFPDLRQGRGAAVEQSKLLEREGQEELSYTVIDRQ